MDRRTVIIAGAGPSGMCAALFLIERHGIPVLVIDRSIGDATDPRAATFHPPTLEMLAPSGITAKLMEAGIVAPKWQRRDRTEGLIAEFDLGVLAQDTTFPFRLQCEQHKLVNIVRRHLAGNPLFELRQGEEVTGIMQDADGVTVKTDKGEYLTDWLVGSDGGRSVVRKSCSVEFKGFTYAERFLVITTDFDFEAEGYAFSNYVADPQEWCAVFKVPADGPPGTWRTVFPTDPADDEAELTAFENCRARMDRFIGAGRDYNIVHTNLYTVNQRVASSFREGRILLAGDAAHLNNPLGGMGMNFGIHDAENLARSLGSWWENGDETALDLYDRQRRFAAEAVLQSITIENKESLEQTDAGAAAAEREKFRRIAADPVATRAYLLKTAMIEGFNKANAIP